MHSGGDSKTDWDHIYVRGDIDTATEIFTRITGRDPENVTCRCCGEDYAVRESDDLMSATAFQRGDYDGKTNQQTIREFSERADVRIITNPDGTM